MHSARKMPTAKFIVIYTSCVKILKDYLPELKIEALESKTKTQGRYALILQGYHPFEQTKGSKPRRGIPIGSYN